MTNDKINFWKSSQWAVALFLLLPISAIFSFLLFSEDGDWQHLFEFLLVDYLQDTFLVTTGVIVGTFALGVFTAYAIVFLDFPFRKLIEILLFLPLAIPSYISALAYIALTDYTSWLGQFWRYMEWGKSFPVSIMNIPGAIFIMSFAVFPYVYLNTRIAFLKISPSIFEVSILHGKSLSFQMFKIMIPLARTGIFAGLFLVVMDVLNEYGVMKLLGVNTFTTGIFKYWLSYGDLPMAVRLALVLLFGVSCLLIFEQVNNQSKALAERSTQKRLKRKRLKGFPKWVVLVLMLIPVFFGFVVPVIQLLYTTFREVLDVGMEEVLSVVMPSFTLALQTALIISLIALVVVFAERINTQVKLNKLFSVLYSFGYAVPGAIISVGLMIILIGLENWLRTVGVKILLSGSVLGLVLAYMVRFFIVPYSSLKTAFSKVSPHLEQASFSLRKSKWQTLLQVDFPVVKTGFFSGVVLIIIEVLKELPLTLILRPFNYDTLAIRTFELASEELFQQASFFALIIIAFSFIPVYFIVKYLD